MNELYHKDAPQYLQEVYALAESKGLRQEQKLPKTKHISIRIEDFSPAELIATILSSGATEYTVDTATGSDFSTTVTLAWVADNVINWYLVNDSQGDVVETLKDAVTEDTRVKHWVAFPRETRLHLMREVVNEYLDNSEQLEGLGKLLLNNKQRQLLQDIVLSDAERIAHHNWQESYEQAIGNPEFMVNTVNFLMGERTYMLESIMRTWFQVYSRGHFPTEEMLETMVAVYHEHNG